MAESIKDMLVAELMGIFGTNMIIPALSDDSGPDDVSPDIVEDVQAELTENVELIAVELLGCDSIDKAEEHFGETLMDVYKDVIVANIPWFSNVAYLEQEAVRIASVIGDILNEIGFIPGIGADDE